MSSEAKVCQHCGQPDPPSCFPGEVGVLTPSGYRPILTLGTGDSVVSVTADGELAIRPVLRQLEHASGRVWAVSLDGAVPSTLRTTRWHSFATQRGWVRCDQLRPGDEVERPSDANRRNCAHTVREVRPTGERARVYNLHTAGEHNFIVDGVLAHNFSFLRTLRGLLAEVRASPTRSAALLQRQTARRLAISVGWPIAQ